MKKILLAIGHRKLEDFLKKHLKNEFKFVEPTVYREGIVRSVGQKNPDIIVIRETLPGKENILSIVYELRKRYSNKRIVFIAGKREVGDVLLATLVSMNIFDILYGEKVKAQDIVRLIRQPNEYKDVQHLQPKPVFDDRTNKVLFEAPEIEEKEIIKEVIKEVYIDNRSSSNHQSISNEELQTSSSKMTEKHSPLNKKDPHISELSPSINNTNPKIQKQQMVKEPLIDDGLTEDEILEKKIAEKLHQVKKKFEHEEVPEEHVENSSKRGLFKFFNAKEENELKILGNQKIITFMSAKDGSGNSSIAFNIAVLLAKQKKKVLFMELDDRHPSVAYWYEFQNKNVDAGIDQAIEGLINKEYKKVEDAIIKVEELRNIQSDFQDNYKKLPRTLDVMFFSNRYLARHSIDSITFDESVTKELYMHLLFQLGYDFIILDISSNIWNQSTLNALMYSNKVFITVTQDVSTIGNAIYVLNELNKREINIDRKKQYIVNKFEKSRLTLKGIKEWVSETKILTVPNANKDFINSNYSGIPVVLHSNNPKLKQAFEAIKNSI